ncbi:MAG TPA: nucleoid-associated protein [Tissierellaceae bacterium]
MIYIKDFIIHILDSNTQLPVLSEHVHPDDLDINKYLTTHIEKSLDDISTKKFQNIDNEEITALFKDLSKKELFLNKSKQLAKVVYEIIYKNGIEPLDLIIINFTLNSKKYIGVFFMYYRVSYLHDIEYLDDKNLNKLVKNITSLPNENQKIDEFIFYNLSDNEFIFKEKNHDIDGIKEPIISKYILEVDVLLSPKEKLDILNKTSKKIVKDYYDDSVNKLAEVNKIILDNVETKGYIDVEDIKDKAFKDNPEVKQAYDDEMLQKGLNDKELSIEGLEKRLPQFQKIILDDEIEIKVPVEILNDKEKLEFIVNSNGTVSIMLKDLVDIKQR